MAKQAWEQKGSGGLKERERGIVEKGGDHWYIDGKHGYRYMPGSSTFGLVGGGGIPEVWQSINLILMASPIMVGEYALGGAGRFNSLCTDVQPVSMHRVVLPSPY